MDTEDTLNWWHEELSALWRRVACWCQRREPRERLWRYLVGLLSNAKRKNGWQLAETMHEHGPQGMQRLLNAATWDVDAVRDEVRTYVAEHFGDAEGIVIADETGFLKQGTHSAGVARQYSGTAGRIENQQIGVFLVYASPHGYAFIDRALYLPDEWTQDRPRCARAGIPTSVTFATKAELAQQMIERALAGHVPIRWFVGDTVYGADSLRLWLEAHHLWYVVAISSNTGIWVSGQQVEAATLAAQQPIDAWVRLSAGEGSQGPRWYDWTWLQLPYASPAGMAHWLVARRSISSPDELAYYHAYAPATTTLAELVQIYGRRWVIELAFAQAKGEVGMDQYEVRQWLAWYRHITLVLLVYAYLAVIRLQSTRSTGVSSGLVPLSVPEVRRLAHALALPDEERHHRLLWSHWRRHHQAMAQMCHTRRRRHATPTAPCTASPAPTLPGMSPLTEEHWQCILHLLPSRTSSTGRPSADHRNLLAAMLWVIRTGVSWREIPATFAPWQTVYTRFQQWVKAGIWDQIVTLLSQGDPSCQAEVSL